MYFFIFLFCIHGWHSVSRLGVSFVLFFCWLFLLFFWLLLLLLDGNRENEGVVINNTKDAARGSIRRCHGDVDDRVCVCVCVGGRVKGGGVVVVGS